MSHSTTDGQHASPYSGTRQDTAALRNRINDLVNRGCKVDDASLISEALSLDSTLGSNRSHEELMQRISNRVWFHNSTKVLTYIITHGSDITTRGARVALSIADAVYDHGFPKDMVEILLAHGWDINARKSGWKPLLWLVIGDGDAVTWCLDRGASVLAQGQRSWPNFDVNNKAEYNKYFEQHPWSIAEISDCLSHCPTLLQVAAGQSTVATFELLRSKGAAMSWRVLHMAVASSASHGPTRETTHEEPPLSDKERARTPQERLAMVRHLVDTLKLDVNALDCPPGCMMGNHYGRPLHYVAMNSGGSCDCRSVTWYLMDRGADPELLDSGGGMTAMALGTENFRDAVNEWRLMKTGESRQNNEKAGREDMSQNKAKT